MKSVLGRLFFGGWVPALALYPLTKFRAKPCGLSGGKYRLIGYFPFSNCINF